MRWRGAMVLGMAGAALLAGCTGVPDSSGPQTVERVRITPPSAAAITPLEGAQPAQIVSGFLDAGAEDTSSNATAARAFLTPAAAGQWSGETVTIVDTLSFGNQRGATVTMLGREVGKVSAAGIYTPNPAVAAPPLRFSFSLIRVKGEYRISQLPSGLLMTESQFSQSFSPHALYFYDLADKHLIPDYRWTVNEDDPLSTAEWLVTQLAAGPSGQLQNAVSTDTLPAQLDPKRTNVRSVQAGAAVQVEIPGASGLAGPVRNRLAAQLSVTLNDLLQRRPITITDNGQPVAIPQVQATDFTNTDFPAYAPAPEPAPDVYYLNGGKIYYFVDHGNSQAQQEPQPLGGALGDGTYSLGSIALTRPAPGGALTVAGVAAGGADGQRLYVGTQYGGLKATSLRGKLSRPAFAPGLAEVWIGDGPRIYRVPASGAKPGPPAPVLVSPASGSGSILALRLSPDGSRIALVIGGTGGAASLWVGAIVRATGQVSIDGLQQISPQNAVVSDVTWFDSALLSAIGHSTGSTEPRTFRVSVDGSDWNSSPLQLGALPDAVTGLASHNVWVSAGNRIWVQTSNGWVSPTKRDTTPGSAPVYLS